MYNDMNYSAFETFNNDYSEFWEMNETLTDDEIAFYDENDAPQFCTDENGMCWYE